MSRKFTRLNRYHGTLEEKLRSETKRRWPDSMKLAKLKKMKLAVKDQLRQLKSSQASPA